jgi:hypothetical protein
MDSDEIRTQKHLKPWKNISYLVARSPAGRRASDRNAQWWTSRVANQMASEVHSKEKSDIANAVFKGIPMKPSFSSNPKERDWPCGPRKLRHDKRPDHSNFDYQSSFPLHDR